MPTEAATRIRVSTAVMIQGRGQLLAAGQLLAGRIDRKLVVRSTSIGDDWEVEQAVVLGAGPPTPYDTHDDGKYSLTFRPLDQIRPIDDGEEFTDAPGS